MSYSKFLDDLNSFYKDKSHKGIHYETAWGMVRDEWIRKGQIDGLILFILENWDLGNCDDFIPPLEKYLFDTKNLQSYKKLWKGIIKIRLNRSNERLDQESKDLLLRGIERFTDGLKTLNDPGEIKKLETLVSGIKQSKRLIYPA